MGSGGLQEEDLANIKPPGARIPQPVGLQLSGVLGRLRDSPSFSDLGPHLGERL